MPRVTITVPEKNAQPYRFPLDPKVVTLGRGGDNDIVIESASVSMHHARMHRIEGGYELRNAGSTNGIKLDGVLHEVIPLVSGTSVKIGDVAFDFLLTEEESETLAREKPVEPSSVVREEVAVEDLPPPKGGSHAPDESDGGGFGATLILLILATTAFFIGMTLRHRKETGDWLIEAIQAKATSGHPHAVPPAPAK